MMCGFQDNKLVDTNREKLAKFYNTIK